MKKIMVIVVMVLVTVLVVPSVTAQEPKLKEFDPLKEVAKVRLLTTADGVRWFQVSAWCQDGIGCWKYERVGFRSIQLADEGGLARCYTERVPKFLKKGSCLLVLLDPLRGAYFASMVDSRQLDKRTFKVLPVPEPTKTPAPTTPTPAPSQTPTPAATSSVFG